MTYAYNPIKPADLKKALKLATKEARGGCRAWIIDDPAGGGHWLATSYFARKIDPALAICLEGFNLEAEATGLEVSGATIVKRRVESFPNLAPILENAKKSADKIDFHRTFGGHTIRREIDHKGKADDLFVIADENGEPLTMVAPEYATIVGMLDASATFTGAGERGIISIWDGEELKSLVMPVRPS